MRVRPIVAIVTAGLVVCAAFAAACVFLLPLVFHGPDIAPRLAAIDAAIAGGSLSTAREELLAVRPFPRREADALRLLKRGFLVSRQSGDPRLLSVMSDRALTVQRRGPLVRLVAAYAYLRVGRLGDAEAAARSGLPAGQGDLVRDEIVLRRGGALRGSDSLTRELVGLETSRRASDFAAAARKIDDGRLALDAALLSMQEGDLSSARSIAASSLGDAKYDEPVSLMDYDAGDFAAASSRLARLQRLHAPRAEVALLLAECLRALGREVDADAALRDALAIDPRVSWTVYANLAVSAEKRDDLSLARAMLARGLSLFPGSRELVLASARLEAGQGNPAGAVALLNGLVAERPEDGEAALLLLSLSAAGMPPEAYRAQLWKLFDRLPSQRNVFLTLAAALVASHDWTGAAAELRRHEEAAGARDSDVLAIRGVVQAMQGRDQLAIESMKQATESPGGAKYRYDLAVLLFHGGNARAALAQLEPAEGANAFLARVETLRGRCLLATGDRAGARAAFLRARALDPHQLRSGLELRKLEAPGLQ